MGLLVAEILLTATAVAMLLWRGFLDMKEEDHLILDEAEAHFAREQAAMRLRVNALSKYIKFVSVAWGALAAIIIAVWVAQSLALL
jgi:hypothetical protein